MSLLQLDLNNKESSEQISEKQKEIRQKSVAPPCAQEETDLDSTLILAVQATSSNTQEIEIREKSNDLILTILSTYSWQPDIKEETTNLELIVTLSTPCSTLQEEEKEGYLIKENYLGEFENEYQRSIARINLGLDARNIPYTNVDYPEFKTVKDALDFLLYVPLTIDSFTLSPNIAELGSVITQLEASWSISKLINNLTLRIGENKAVFLDPTSTSSTINFISINQNTTVELIAEDNRQRISAFAPIIFVLGIYYGSLINSPTVTDIINNNISRILTTETLGTIQTAGQKNKYIYLMFPYEVDLLEQSFELIDDSYPLSIYMGTTLNYYLYRSAGTSLGEVTIQWQKHNTNE